MSIQITDSAAFTIDDLGNVWFVGSFEENVLGIESSSVPTKIEGLKDIVDICCGTTYCVCVDLNGNAWYLGKLFGNTVHEPTEIPELSNIIKVKSGYKHVVFLNSEGQCFGAGGNKAGEIGEHNESDPNLPVRIQTDFYVKDIACGAYHTIFLSDEGKVFGCGSNNFGQIGRNGRQITITEIVYPECIVSICSGSYHTLALSEAGGIWSMGSSTLGKLGVRKTSGQSDIPVKVVFDDDDSVIVKYIEAGSNHSLAIDAGGNLWGFGKLFKFNRIRSQAFPVLFNSISNVTTISHGGKEGFIVKTIDKVIVISDAEIPPNHLGPIHEKQKVDNTFVWGEEYLHTIGDSNFRFSKQKSARK